MAPNNDQQTNLFAALAGEAIPGVTTANQLAKKPAKKAGKKRTAKKPTSSESDGEQPVWSVSDLTQHLRDTFKADPVLGQTVTVRGELSNVSPSSRGHVYMTLKDDSASLRGVIWASKAARLKFDIDDGMEVFATGKLDVYAAGGSYSLVIDRLEPVGIGALQLAYEQLKAKLTEEGLFDDERKQPLPAFPQRIGIVTAKTGAVIHDMLRVIRRKNPQLDVLLAPVPVQGDGAAEAIAAAITHLNQPQYNLDLLIVGRGGGSFDDLFCFSEEPVVRAIANSLLPIVAGVGHEPDFSLADAAADVTCSTPTAAAETAVPDTVALRDNLTAIEQFLAENLTHALTTAEQHLDRASDSLVSGVTNQLTTHQQQVALHREKLLSIGDGLLTPPQQQLDKLAVELNTLSPLNTLKRGYWVVTQPSGSVVTNLAENHVGDTIHLRSETTLAQATLTHISPVTQNN